MLCFSLTEQPVLQQASVCFNAVVKGQAGYITNVAIKAEQNQGFRFQFRAKNIKLNQKWVKWRTGKTQDILYIYSKNDEQPTVAFLSLSALLSRIHFHTDLKTRLFFKTLSYTRFVIHVFKVLSIMFECLNVHLLQIRIFFS